MELRRSRTQAARSQKHAGRAHQAGMALVMALIALSIFSIISLYLSLIATSEVRMSDNYESDVQARAAAMAGLNHARALLRGLSFDDLVRGPDGTYDASVAYAAYARTHQYRNPISWAAARMLNILDPGSALTGIPDDGILNSGRTEAGDGTVLIPLVGIAQLAPNPYGEGARVVSRYFVKASDNNGEVSELAGDPADNPFVDGDGQIIVRSLGLAQTLGEQTAAGTRRNSVVVFEARFKRYSTFDLDASLVVQGGTIEPESSEMFEGNLFSVLGGSSNPGIATINSGGTLGVAPAQQIVAQLTPVQYANVQGAGMEPSVSDITAAITTDADKRLLLDASFLQRFVRVSLPRFADNAYTGPQNWNGAAPASLGSYDSLLPPASAGQAPRVTYVDGDLVIEGNLSGAGLLVVTGKLVITGNFSFKGLLLIIGAGEFTCGGLADITGAAYVANLSESNGALAFGPAKLTIRESGRLTFNRDLVRMAVRLIPPVQLGVREVTSIIDP